MVRFSHIAWGVLLAVSVLVSIWTEAPAFAAVTLALIVVPVIGLVVAHFAVRSISSELESATTTQKGRPASCMLRLKNSSVLPLVRVQTTIEVSNLLTLQKQPVVLRAALAPRSSIEVPFQVQSAVCGRLALRMENVRIYEPFGLFSVRVSAPAERRMSVMPNLHEAHLSSISAASPLSDTTVFSPYVKGPDASEVFGLREYEQGDDLRRIHWKLSDKIDKLIVREASLPLDSSLLVFWDKSFFTTDADDATRVLQADALAEVMLSICEYLAHEGIEYEVAFNELPQERCLSEHVSDESRIYELVSHAITFPMMLSGESGLASYLREFGRFACARLIYLGAALPPELAALSRNCSVLAFICDNTLSLESDASFITVHFLAGDAASALAQAEVA